MMEPQLIALYCPECSAFITDDEIAIGKCSCPDYRPRETPFAKFYTRIKAEATGKPLEVKIKVESFVDYDGIVIDLSDKTQWKTLGSLFSSIRRLASLRWSY